MAICAESCNHFFNESVCGDTFVKVATLLHDSNLTVNFDSYDNCSSFVHPLYNVSVSRTTNCQRFNSKLRNYYFIVIIYVVCRNSFQERNC